MHAYKRLEYLRLARSTVSFADANSSEPQPSERRRFITEQSDFIESAARTLWPNAKPRQIQHWTALNLQQRARAVSVEAEALYVHSYKHFSWYVHGGIQGTLEAPPEHIPRVCGMALCLSVISYAQMLTLIARAMQLTIHDEVLGKKVEFALGLPLTESPEDELALRRALGLQR